MSIAAAFKKKEQEAFISLYDIIYMVIDENEDWEVGAEALSGILSMQDDNLWVLLTDKGVTPFDKAEGDNELYSLHKFYRLYDSGKYKSKQISHDPFYKKLGLKKDKILKLLKKYEAPSLPPEKGQDGLYSDEYLYAKSRDKESFRNAADYDSWVREYLALPLIQEWHQEGKKYTRRKIALDIVKHCRNIGVTTTFTGKEITENYIYRHILKSGDKDGYI